MNYLKKYIKNYGNFTGRATRKEWWVTGAYLFIIFLIIMFIGTVVANVVGGDGVVGGYIFLIVTVVGLIPATLSLHVRRLHDVGFSGWWLLLVIIPTVGPIALLVLMGFLRNPMKNKFGLSPYESEDKEDKKEEEEVTVYKDAVIEEADSK